MPSQTFNPTGEPQNFTVPDGVRELTVWVVGGKGHGRSGANGGRGGGSAVLIAATAEELVVAGGGGGSSYVIASATNLSHGVSLASEDGFVTLTW